VSACAVATITGAAAKTSSACVIRVRIAFIKFSFRLRFAFFLPVVSPNIDESAVSEEEFSVTKLLPLFPEGRQIRRCAANISIERRAIRSHPPKFGTRRSVSLQLETSHG